MKENKSTGSIPERVCPKCGAVYRAPAAVSREDNETLICPACGTREALAAFGCSADEQERILDMIRGYEAGERRHGPND